MFFYKMDIYKQQPDYWTSLNHIIYIEANFLYAVIIRLFNVSCYPDD